MVSANTSIVLFIAFIALSCTASSENEKLLEDYTFINCSIKKLTQRKNNFDSSFIQPLKSALSSFEKEYYTSSSFYDNEVEKINNKKALEDTKYTEEYIALSQKHEQKHGHMMTSDYQEKIEGLERKKKDQLTLLDQQLEKVENKRSADELLHTRELQITDLKKKIKEAQKQLNEDYEVPLTLYRKQLQEINNQIEDRNLHKERDSIKHTICNQ